MDAFLSFHAPGFWLVMALLGAVVVVGGRPFLPQTVRPLVIPAYWVLLPYLALISGGVSPRLMGLVYIDWAVSLRTGIGLALALIALAVVARAVSASTAAQTPAEPIIQRRWWRPTMLTVGLCGVEEFFWSFLRGASVELLIIQQFSVEAPSYRALWIAALCAVPISLVNTTGAYNRLIKVAILVMTTVAFFYTHNFWLCWILHAAVWLLFRQPAQHRLRGNGFTLANPAATTTEKSRSQ